MSAGAITGTTANTVAPANGFASMTSADFIKVMMSELSHQDPFQPQDSSKLLDQFSSLRNIESQLQLQSTLSALGLQDQLSAAGGLIGKMVTGLDDNNNPVNGLVTSIQIQNGKAMLELDSGKTLAMERVTQIAPAPASTPAPATTAAH